MLHQVQSFASIAGYFSPEPVFCMESMEVEQDGLELETTPLVNAEEADSSSSKHDDNDADDRDKLLVDPVARNALYQLYASHFLSTWNSRLFEYGAVLFLAVIYKDTLLAISIYAVTRGVAAIVFAEAVGRWIDNGHRLRLVKGSIVLQRIPVILSCVILWAMSVEDGLMPRYLKAGLFAATALLACLEKVSSVVNMISVERDWVRLDLRSTELIDAESLL